MTEALLRLVATCRGGHRTGRSHRTIEGVLDRVGGPDGLIWLVLWHGSDAPAFRDRVIERARARGLQVVATQSERDIDIVFETAGGTTGVTRIRLMDIEAETALGVGVKGARVVDHAALEAAVQNLMRPRIEQG